MAVTKTTVISIRVPPDIKAALAAAAAAERRSLATMVEVMVLDYCRRRSIAVPVSKPLDMAVPAKSTKNL
jgi:hypothetical protein